MSIFKVAQSFKRKLALQKDAEAKLKAETGSSLQYIFSKYADNAAPSAHIRAWDPSAKESGSGQKPSINHVEGNTGTDRKATDVSPGLGVDAPSHKATNSSSNGGVNAPSHKATDRDVSDARTAGGAPLNEEESDKESGNSGSGGNGPSDVRSPTSTEVRSPTSTEVRSPTSTSTEVRSPTSTSTEAYTADNFTATVTGGAGAGANTTVNIYVTPQQKNNSNVPVMSKDKKSSIRSKMSIFKVAQSFKRKLALASAQTVEDLRKLMGYASSLATNYNYTETEYDSTQNLASATYQLWMAAKKGTSSDELTSKLDSVKRMIGQLMPLIKDQAGKNKLSSINSVLGGIQLSDTKAPIEEEPLPAAMQNAVPTGTSPLPWEADAQDRNEQQTQTLSKDEIEAEQEAGKQEKANLNPNWRYIPHKW